MKKLLTISAVCALLLAVTAWAGEEKKEEGQKPKTEQKAESKAKVEEKKAAKIEWKETKSGLKWADLKEGEGKAAVNGDKVEVHYHLWLADENGEKGKDIQNSRDFGKTFKFTVGQRGLIEGWNEGMVGMKPGGTRILYIPSKLGYGKAGMGKDIPPDSDLIFELDFIGYTDGGNGK